MALGGVGDGKVVSRLGILDSCHFAAASLSKTLGMAKGARVHLSISQVPYIHKVFTVVYGKPHAQLAVQEGAIY